MIRASMVLFLTLASPLAYAEIPAGANDFPQWRGPNRDGISRDKGLLKQWPAEGPKVAWQIDEVGVGYSSLAIKDGLIVTMGDLDGVEHIIALRTSDGARVWAVQPEPMAKDLAAKIDQELTSMDRNKDGRVDEVEALSRLGWDFHKYDRDGDASTVAARAAKVLAELDTDKDGRLSYNEAGNVFRDHFTRMDTADKSKASEIAPQRAAELIREADEDKDGKVSQKEAKKNYLGRVFSQIDVRDKATNKGDELLTLEEVVGFFNQHEAGKDGVITGEEFTAYYTSNVTGGDGQLSRDEARGLHGGFRNDQGDGPRGTPTIDGDRVYTEGGNGDVTCLDLKSGNTLWYRSLTKDFGGSRPGWGYSESPLIVNDLVIVTPGGKEGTIAALNKLTGEVVWRSTENTEAAHYSSPILATLGGVQQIVQFGRESVFGVTLDKGKLLWRYSAANNGTANCCTPIADQNHVFVASAYGTGGGLAKIANQGPTQSAEEVYFEKKMGIHHGGIVKIGDYMYTNGAGTLMCVNFLTGEMAWQDRSVGKGSLVAADGMLYVLSERQELALVEATPEGYRERGRIKLESQGRPSWAHPVVAGGRLYVRDQKMLTAFELR